MIATGNQIELFEFNIHMEKLYDKLKHNRNLFIYSSFNDIKNGFRNLDHTNKSNKSSHYQGKNLRWEFKSGLNKLEVQLQNQQKFSLDFNSHIGFEHLQILSNDDVVLYGYCIYILGFNETTNTIVFKYFYNDKNNFLEMESPPNLTFPIKYITSLCDEIDEIDLINELLCSRKYLVEMSNEIIGYAIDKNKSRLLDTCLNKLYEALTEDTTTNYRICGFITKYLPKLKEKFKLVGYTSQAHKLQVYNCIEGYVIRLILWISKVFQKLHFLYRIIAGKYKNGRHISFIVPCFEFTKYKSDYEYWEELIKPPKDILFVALDDQTFYDSWNAEALLNFKWDTFGRSYYYLLWGFFTMFMLSFGIGSTLSSSIISDDTRNIFLRISIILGSFHMIHEIRQCFWDPIRYFRSIWNWFDLSAIIVPDEPVQNDDPNNPWNLVTKYQSVTPNGEINSGVELIQQPDSKLNQFSTYPTSLLAMYLFLTGDSSALASWAYQENPFMTVLLVIFSFLIVVYLMNLIIGLLNLEIEGNRMHFLFKLQKAEILAEIELFLLLPNQRRWQDWFPDVIFYDIPIEDVQKRIIEIDNPLSISKYISEKLRNLAKLEVKNDDPMTNSDYMKKSDYENLVNMFKDEIRNTFKSR
ncbi:1014_t:CDS:2 [Funneliformis geosporum]|nr:1014_t:CDS:2 [Funneliformis geosporum]